MQTVSLRFPSGAVVWAELARRPADIERGLMYRRTVPEGTGMLFDMGRTAVHRFWMKHTWVPLDQVFLNAAGGVVGIIQNRAPGDLAARGVDVPSRYVLEVPGGWCWRHGVCVGQRAVALS